MSRVGTDGRAHAKLSASESSRWINCPGSVRAIENLPPELQRKSSIEADRGTAAHSLAELAYAKKKPARYFLGKEIMGFVVNEDMADAVQVYLDIIKDLKKEFPDGDVFVEKRFHLDWLHPDCFGTNDFSIAQMFGTLVVVDYKHGAGVEVHPENNSQLMYYATGIAKEYDFNFDKIRLGIVQPRCPSGGVNFWEISGE